MNNSYHILVTKIERFIKKYYLNRLLKGLLYSTFLLVLLYLAINTLEYFAYLKTTLRAVIFYGYLLFAAFVFYRYILLPVYKLLAYRKSMPYEQAAVEIGRHFPEVGDKLLNTLQLNHLSNELTLEDSLLMASIEQKINRLRPIPFNNAVDLRQNMKYLRFALFPIAVLMLLLFVFPGFVVGPSKRIIDFKTVYNKPLPFEIQVVNKDFKAVQHEDFEIHVHVSGSEIPGQLTLVSSGFRYSMGRKSPSEFTYTFKKLTEDVIFRIETPGFVSDTYRVKVFPKPVLLAYEANVTYPAYTKRNREAFRELTRIAVPEGSAIEWVFRARDTDHMLLVDDTIRALKSLSATSWGLKEKVLKRREFSLRPTNKHQIESSELQFVVEVIPDEHPGIEVVQADKDDVGKNRFYTGVISDDYGFTRLNFVYQIVNPSLQEEATFFYTPIDVERQLANQQFYHFFSADSMNVIPGDRVNYFFEVWDNDRVNGPKSSRTPMFTLEIMSEEQMDSVSKNKETDIARRMDDMLRESTELRKELDDFRRELMQKKNLDWSDRDKLKSLLNKQQQLQQQMTDMQNEREKLNQFDRDNQLVNERILEKQELINELMEEVIPDDMLKMMNEIQELLNELNRDQVQEMLENMRMNNDQFEQMLDRNLSLLKQLQVEKALNDLLETIEETAESLDQLGDKTMESDVEESVELQQMLEELSSDFENSMKTLDSLRQENSKLQRPFDLNETAGSEKQITDELNQADEALEKNQPQKSGQKQKNAAGKMNELSQTIAMMMKRSQQQQQAEDAHSMRILLENIVRSSLLQEEIMDQLSGMRRDDPAYVEVIREQTQIRQSFKVVEDSLRALSKRQAMIENFILGETETVNRRMNEALNAMKDRKTAEALDGQQFSMMSLNNLGLMLAEALKNLQESMGMPSPMQGEGECSGSSPGEQMQNMRELQEGLGQKMKDLMENGQQGPEGGQPSMSEEIARMAAEQEAIRQQMQNYLDELKSQGGDGGKALQEIIQDMDKLEEDLVNRRINQELMQRQEDLVLRLLESEKAEKERELDEQRQSNEFKGGFLSNPSAFFEYKRLIEKQRDELRLAPVELQPFFRNRVSAYFLRTNKTQTDE
jgi:hypothetical protein